MPVQLFSHKRVYTILSGLTQQGILCAACHHTLITAGFLKHMKYEIRKSFNKNQQ